MRCQSCGGSLSGLGKFPYRDFDRSIFNFVAELAACNACGTVRVISSLADDDISLYYSTDCLNSVLTGVGAGGDSPEDTVRYEYYYGIIKNYWPGQHAKGLVDVGCSRGGFLKYIKKIDKELKISGVDLDEKSLKHLEGDAIQYHIGGAKHLPFAAGSQAVLCYFHVLEHFVDFHDVIGEAARVLETDGVAVFEVPDALCYGQAEARVGTLFWLSIKEHVNHFTPKALAMACGKHGLDVVETRQALMPMKSGKYYPSLIVVAKKGRGQTVSEIQYDPGLVVGYINAERQAFKTILSSLTRFLAGYEKICFWGIGLEFFNLLANCEPQLAGHNICLVDSNPGKQGLAVNDIRVMPPASVTPDGCLICCSYYSSAAIVKDALKLGWNEQDIFTFS